MDEPRPGFFRRYRETILTILGLLFTAAVAAVTGYSSWSHIVHVGESVQEPNAGLLPVSIDGMMLASTVMAAVDNLRGYKTRWWAVIGLWLGSALTLAFNLASAWARGPFAMLIAVLYAVALLVTVEMMFHPSRTPLDAVRKWRGKISTIAALEQQTSAVAAPSTPVPTPVEPAPVVVQTPEPTQSETPAAPTPEPRTPAKNGRRPGPQTPPEGRRVRTRHYSGGGVQPTKKSDGELSDEDLVEAIVIEGPEDRIPEAEGEGSQENHGAGVAR